MCLVTKHIHTILSTSHSNWNHTSYILQVIFMNSTQLYCDMIVIWIGSNMTLSLGSNVHAWLAVAIWISLNRSLWIVRVVLSSLPPWFPMWVWSHQTPPPFLQQPCLQRWSEVEMGCGVEYKPPANDWDTDGSLLEKESGLLYSNYPAGRPSIMQAGTNSLVTVTCGLTM